MFRKKSDDPWDRKPEKRPNLRETFPQDPPDSEGPWTPPEREEEEGWNPGKRLDEWLEKRRAAAEAKAESANKLPPIKCPWCGQDMTQGYIYGRGDLWWNPGIFTLRLFEMIPVFPDTVRLSEYGPRSYKIAWRCKACEKIVIDTTPREPEEKEEPEENGT